MGLSGKKLTRRDGAVSITQKSNLSEAESKLATFGCRSLECVILSIAQGHTNKIRRVYALGLKHLIGRARGWTEATRESFGRISRASVIATPCRSFHVVLDGKSHLNRI